MAILRCLNGKFIPKTDSLFFSHGDVFDIESFNYERDRSGGSFNSSFTITVYSENYLLKEYFIGWMMTMCDKDGAMIQKGNIIDTLLISDPDNGVQEMQAFNCIPVEFGEGEFIFRADWVIINC